jgi:hypothetical protein
VDVLDGVLEKLDDPDGVLEKVDDPDGEKLEDRLLTGANPDCLQSILRIS